EPRLPWSSSTPFELRGSARNSRPCQKSKLYSNTTATRPTPGTNHAATDDSRPVSNRPEFTGSTPSISARGHSIGRLDHRLGQLIERQALRVVKLLGRLPCRRRDLAEPIPRPDRRIRPRLREQEDLGTVGVEVPRDMRRMEHQLTHRSERAVTRGLDGDERQLGLMQDSHLLR